MAATSQERRVGSTTKIETLVELRERLEAEALHAFRYGGEDPDAVRLRREVCALLDRVDRRFARLTGAEEAA